MRRAHGALMLKLSYRPKFLQCYRKANLGFQEQPAENVRLGGTD
jgi:hypothetical protein